MFTRSLTICGSLFLFLNTVLYAQSVHLARCADCTTVPKIISIPKPKLTDEIKAKQLSGKVVLSIAIDEIGNVTDVQVVSGNDSLVQSAMESAKSAKFVPSRSVGSPDRPIKSSAMIVYNFVLPSKSVRKSKKGHR